MEYTCKQCLQRQQNPLRRNLYSCPQEVKEAAYKGLVRPVLDYGSSVPKEEFAQKVLQL